MDDRVEKPAVGRVKPISQFVLKVHSRCDLACDHCYVYEHVDQSWRNRPVVIEPETTRRAAMRIAEHAAAHGLSIVHVILHGGEPLLLGERRLREVLAELREHISRVTTLQLGIQTNGVRLSPELCEVLSEYGVRVGISLDGDRSANDRHRLYANGRSSHDQVLKALELLRTPSYRHLYAGILCTVDIENDPVDVLEAVLAEEPPRIDFLLPHATWDHPPPRPVGRPTAYADWLGSVFSRWVALGRPVPVRLFDSLASLAIGGPSRWEGAGLDPVDLLVIETGGEWEQVDSLKTAYDGAAATGLNVFEHSVNRAAAHPAIAARRGGIESLAHVCRTCPVVSQCGGGLYSHRYKEGSGFDNPSVYCSDLKSLIFRVGIPGPVPAVTGGGGIPADADTTLVDAIAEKPADEPLVRRLAREQLAVSRVVFAAVGDLTSACVHGPGAVGCAAAGWELMCALELDHADAVESVLEHPFARAWAQRCRRPESRCGRTCTPESAHLASFAIAAAVRAGVDAELAVPLHDGFLYLPTLGALDLRRSTGRYAVVVTQDGGFEVRTDRGRDRVRIGDPARPGQDWRVAREVGDRGHRIRIEDQDPYRDCHGWRAADRISTDAVQAWHRMLISASAALRDWSVPYADQIRACVRTVVPLVSDPAGLERSATSRDAFAAFGAALPADPQALAMLMVHESQHMLLDTIFDTHDLFSTDDERTFEVAWRTDPRPISGALQGAFANVGMAEVWHARGRAPGEGCKAALTRARRHFEWADQALDSLMRAGALTRIGERFAAALGIRMRRSRDE